MAEARRRGERLPYRLLPTPLGHGGFAEVFAATHRDGGSEVALKRAKNVPDAAARLRREIEVQSRLVHPNIMPILDFDPDFTWFVMPRAEGNLEKLRTHLDDEDLATLLLSVLDALEVAHDADLIHRDIAPGNILALPARQTGRRWVVADWGMVHRPPSTSIPPLTRAGQGMGTDGFAAPEVWTDATAATPAADVYSVGRVVAWFLTGTWPMPNQNLLPDGKYQHWRGFVRASTEPNVADRIKTIPALRARFGRVFAIKDQPVEERAAKLVEEMFAGAEGRLRQLADLALDHLDNQDVFIDWLAQAPSQQLRVWVAAEPDAAARLGQTMARMLNPDSWGDRDPEYIGTPLTFVLLVLSSLVTSGHEALAEDLAEDYFLAVTRCRFAPHRLRSTQWLEVLDEGSGRFVTRAISAHPEVVAYLHQPPGWRAASRSIQQLLADAGG